MSFQNFYKTSFGAFFTVVIISAANAFAPTPRPTPKLIVAQDARPMPVVGKNNLYCAGYVETGTVDFTKEIVGAEKEQEKMCRKSARWKWLT